MVRGRRPRSTVVAGEREVMKDATGKASSAIRDAVRDMVDAICSSLRKWHKETQLSVKAGGRREEKFEGSM